MNLIRAILHPLTITLSLAISTLTAQTVTTSKGLSAAIAAANTSATATTINLAGGTYDLTTDLPGLAANSLTLQGPASGTPAIIDAAGLSSGIIFNVTADHIVIANLTLRNARNHAVAIQPGADSGRIENCAFDNPTAPLPATAAIDGNGCLNWTVTRNRISNIVGTAATAEPAIHFYGGASGTTVTDNFVLNCDRAIGLGGDSVPFVPPTPVAPAIATQPASVTVNAGQTATFTIVATGTPSPSYQWRKNGTAISGATSAFYTTPVTIPADTGASFSVVLTNSAATITSNAAVLTVNTASTAPFPIGVWLQHALGNMRNNGQYDSVNYKSAGVNTYVGLWKFPYSGWADAEDSAAALTQLKELGIKVYAGSDQSAVDWLAAHPEYANTVVGYMLGDEPEMNKVNVTDPSQHLLDPSMPDGWKAAGDAIRSADGNRGRYANFGKGFALDPWVGYSILPGPTQADDFAKYVEPLTVLSSDFYGITDPWESANNHGIWTYGRAVTNTLKSAGTRPVWGFVEASAPFNETENGGQGSQRAIAFRMPPNYIMPIVWNMVVHGARGIIYFCHDFSTTGNTGGALGEPGMYDAMKAANESVQQYAAVLATDTVSGTSATTDGAVGVTTLTKKYSGATYVFAMAEGDSGHIQGQAVNSTITLAGGGSGTVEVVGENRSIAMTKGAMATEHFDAYGIHIYRILDSNTVFAPVITTQPASITVTTSQTATFTVVATGTPSYQWRKNGTAISGATSASYTTPATTTTDNGAIFGVVVTNTAGSVTSGGATLTVNPATAISHGSQINETNTGVPSGHTLADVSSTVIVTEAWISGTNGGSRIIENKHFLSGARLIVTVDGFTVRYCKFSGVGGFSTDANDGQSTTGKNVVITDCEFDGNHENLRDDVAVGGSYLTLKRVHIHRWPRAMWIGEGNVWVEECYMHDLTVDGSGAHIENIYVAGGANQTYIRNRLISNAVSLSGGSGSISASLAIYNESWATFPELNYIVIENNYLESDGGYALYGGACVGKGAPYAKNTVVRGNVFGRGIQRNCGVYGPVTAFDPAQSGNLWINNTWGARGAFWQAGDPEEGAQVGAPGPT